VLDRKGRTPLHHAVALGSKPVIAELVANGASLAARDKEGKQPIDFAADSPELEMILTLLNPNIPRTGDALRGLSIQ
jgi:ankyrin repeat protein